MIQKQDAYSTAALADFLWGLANEADNMPKSEQAGALRAIAAVRSAVVEYGLSSRQVGNYMARSRANRGRFGDTVIVRQYAAMGRLSNGSGCPVDGRLTA